MEGQSGGPADTVVDLPPVNDFAALEKWAETRHIEYDDTDKQEARDAAMGSMTVYVLGQLCGLYTIFTRENEVQRALRNGDSVPACAFLALTVLTDLLYYRLVVSDPGWLPKPHESPPLPKASDLRDLLSESSERLPDGLRDQQWCRYCRIVKPIRTKHCHKCGRCIAKFDHHCFWLWNCVGTRNHRLFWWFLLALVVTMGWGNHLVWSSYTLSLSDGLWGNLKKHCVPILASLLGISMWLFVVPLFIGHTGAALFNVTTWEFLKRYRIPYLKTLPEDYNPFDEGIGPNLWFFCCDTSKIVWDMPSEDTQKRRKGCCRRYHWC